MCLVRHESNCASNLSGWGINPKCDCILFRIKEYEKKIEAWEPIVRAAINDNGIFTRSRDILWAAIDALPPLYRPKEIK